MGQILGPFQKNFDFILQNNKTKEQKKISESRKLSIKVTKFRRCSEFTLASYQFSVIHNIKQFTDDIKIYLSFMVRLLLLFNMDH